MNKKSITTREAYFKSKVLCDLPVGLLFYLYRRAGTDNVLDVTSITVRFSNEDDENNIVRMNEIESSPSFVMWGVDPNFVVKSIKLSEPWAEYLGVDTIHVKE